MNSYIIKVGNQAFPVLALPAVNPLSRLFGRERQTFFFTHINAY